MGVYLTQEEVIKQLQLVHGTEKFCYDETKYVDCKTKLKIFCNQCRNYFFQIYGDHKRGFGCSTCSGNKPLTKEKFIEIANNVHNNFYRYDNVIMVNNHTKVQIDCPDHGTFEQIPKDHMKGRGCSLCGGSNVLTNEEFIIRAQKLHGDMYDYSLVSYVNAFKKVKIRCKKHDFIFEMKPNSHLSNQGCRKCGNELVSITKLSNTKEFIEDSIKVHGMLYDYSKVCYINCFSEVIIICQDHKEFLQTPSSHKAGHGCPRCGFSRFSKQETEWLKLINIHQFYRNKSVN